MKTNLHRSIVAAFACLLALAAFNVAEAHRGEGGSCTSCHTVKAGSISASPNPLDIKKGNTGLLTFSIASLGGSTQSAISVQGLENPALNASIAPGGNTWTYINGDSGMSYVSNTITTTGSYTLNLAIGNLATPGTYPIAVEFAGKGDRATTTSFNLRVMLAALAGDFNQDNKVDAADYTVWRDGLGSTYTQADYDTWKLHFGQTAGAAAVLVSSAVPEPATVALLLAGVCAALVSTGRRRP